MSIRKPVIAVVTLTLALGVTGCSSKRQISVEGTDSTQVQGTSWYRFCDGPNAFIWVQSRTDSEPDELEAIIYDHWACVTDETPSGSSTEDPAQGDADGIIEDEEN